MPAPRSKRTIRGNSRIISKMGRHRLGTDPERKNVNSGGLIRGKASTAKVLSRKSSSTDSPRLRSKR